MGTGGGLAGVHRSMLRGHSSSGLCKAPEHNAGSSLCHFRTVAKRHF